MDPIGSPVLEIHGDPGGVFQPFGLHALQIQHDGTLSSVQLVRHLLQALVILLDLFGAEVSTGRK